MVTTSTGSVASEFFLQLSETKSNKVKQLTIKKTLLAFMATPHNKLINNELDIFIKLLILLFYKFSLSSENLIFVTNILHSLSAIATEKLRRDLIIQIIML
jgi:hypothetical protein